MLLRLGAAWAVVVSSVAAARDVTRSHDADCCNRPVWACISRVSYGSRNIAFSPYGGYCRAMRAVLGAQLHGARGVGAAWAARQEQVDRLMSALGDAATAAASVELDKHVFRVVDGIIGTVTYGGVHGAEADRFQLLEDAVDIVGRFSAEDFFPNATGRLVDRLSGIVARRERTFAKLDAFFEAVLEKHLDPACPKPESGGGDLVDTLLGVCKEKALTRDHVKAVLLDAFVGGVDTSHVTVLWAMSELIRTPRAIKKAQEEVRSAVATGNMQRVQPSDLPKLTYLKMVVKEQWRSQDFR